MGRCRHRLDAHPGHEPLERSERRLKLEAAQKENPAFLFELNWPRNEISFLSALCSILKHSVERREHPHRGHAFPDYPVFLSLHAEEVLVAYLEGVL